MAEASKVNVQNYGSRNQYAGLIVVDYEISNCCSNYVKQIKNTHNCKNRIVRPSDDTIDG